MDLFVDFSKVEQNFSEFIIEEIASIVSYPPLIKFLMDDGLTMYVRVDDDYARKELEKYSSDPYELIIGTIMYLQPTQFMKLFNKYKNDSSNIMHDIGYNKKYGGILHKICHRCLTTSYFYSCNVDRYDAIFWHILKNTKDINSYIGDIIPTPFVIAVISDKIHYAMAMLDHGYDVTEDELQILSDSGKQTVFPFIFSWKLNAVELCDKPHSMLGLIELNKHKTFTHPVVDMEGEIYEKEVALKLAKTKNIVFLDFKKDEFIYSDIHHEFYKAILNGV